MTTPFISYAQNGEDIVIHRVFADLDGPGYFVDVGAADPIGYSATFALYELGWHGINIEPVARFAHALRSIRPRDLTLEMAVGSDVGTIEINVADGTGLSSGASNAADRLRGQGFSSTAVEVPVSTLARILDEHCPGGQEIHLLKIDVEGMEASVLAGADFTRRRPWLCVVESTVPLTQDQNHDEWEHLLLDHDYVACLFDGLNRYYLATEHAALAPRLQSGPCVFDLPYQRADVSLAIERHAGDDAAALREARSHLEAQTEALDHHRRSIEHLENVIAQLRADAAAADAAATTERERSDEAIAQLHRSSEVAAAEIEQREVQLVGLRAESEQNRADLVALRRQTDELLEVIRTSQTEAAELRSRLDSHTGRIGSAVRRAAGATGLDRRPPR